MRSWVQGVFGRGVALLFPTRCLGCDRGVADADELCAGCAPLVEWLVAACPRCARPLPSSRSSTSCLACLAAPPRFATARAVAIYGGPIAQALGRLKFGGRADVAEPLGRLLGRLPLPLDSELVVPVPLADERLAGRGYNQAQLLGQAMGRRLPIAPTALRRRHATRAQAKLPSLARQRNVADVFVADPRQVTGRAVVLVDDVLTTGATARACTEALQAAGARRVDVLTAARAVP